MEFRGWFNEDDGHDYGDELDEIILRTRNPEIKRRLEAMRDGEWSDLGTDTVPAKFAGGMAENEPFRQIISALRREERSTGLPLVDLFGAMLAGRDAEFQRARFGHQAAAGRAIVVRTIEQYARAKNIAELVHLVRKYRDDGSAGPNRYMPQESMG